MLCDTIEFNKQPYDVYRNVNVRFYRDARVSIRDTTRRETCRASRTLRRTRLPTGSIRLWYRVSCDSVLETSKYTLRVVKRDKLLSHTILTATASLERTYDPRAYALRRELRRSRLITNNRHELHGRYPLSV